LAQAVADRVALLRRLRSVLLLDRERLVEQGTHQELIAAGGRYAELYAIQAAAYRDGADGPTGDGGGTAMVPPPPD
jgi:ABC-type transport system involved in cytochrome bd biosynthesis fused ATPase/permease subunit